MESMDLHTGAIAQAGILWDQMVGDGDLTTENLFPYARHTVAVIHALKELSVCGIDMVESLIKKGDSSVEFRPGVKEGQVVSQGDKIARLEGNGRAILTGWRVGNPILSLLSRIQTAVREVVAELQSSRLGVTHSMLLPAGYDRLICYALSVGGGETFGLGLDEVVYLTQEHTDWVGSIQEVIDRTIKEVGENRTVIKIIVEVSNPQQAASVEGHKVNYVYCRGFSAEDVRKTGDLTQGWTKLMVDETVSVEEAKALRNAGVRLYQIDVNRYFQPENVFSINFVK